MTSPSQTRRPRTVARRMAAASTLAATLAATPAAAQVGLAQLDIAGPAGAVPVTLSYPTASANRPVAYGPFMLQVVPDAPPLPGPHRLVVMSHGTGGSWVTDHDLAAALVRAGFVVAQPLHQGDNFRDTSRAGPESWASRPREVRQVIDALAAHPDWRARLKLDRVGVHGMSAGGGTALVMAGAQWRTLDLVRHCLANGEADLGFCYNGLPDGAAQAPRRAQFEQARGVPELFLPAALKQVQGGRTPDAPGGDPRPDARVAAVSAAVPVAALFSTDSLARIQVPVGVVTAGRDTMLPARFHAARVLRDCTACQPLADLPGAGHMDLLAPFPPDLARAEAARQPRGGALQPGFDPAERAAAAQAIADFHRRHLGAASAP